MRTNYGELMIDIDDRTGRAKPLVNRTNAQTVPPAPAPDPRISQDDGKPKYRSKLEARYAGHLDAQRHTGQIRDVRYEALRLKLAANTTYQPDFLVELPDRTVELHEVKGFMREDAWLKLKTAAALWPWFRFFLITRRKSEWIVKRVPSA